MSQFKDPVSVERIEKLHPLLREEARAVIESLWALGIRVRVTYTLRTFAEQDALYAISRTVPGKKVTNAKGGQSFHNYGLALDFCLLSENGRMAVWDTRGDYNGDKKGDWKQVADAFKARGWSWGGDWTRFTDMPHVEKSFGLTIRECYAKYLTGTKPYFTI